jgi:predicted DNA-binding protein
MKHKIITTVLIFILIICFVLSVNAVVGSNSSSKDFDDETETILDKLISDSGKTKDKIIKETVEKTLKSQRNNELIEVIFTTYDSDFQLLEGKLINCLGFNEFNYTEDFNDEEKVVYLQEILKDKINTIENDYALLKNFIKCEVNSK